MCKINKKGGLIINRTIFVLILLFLSGCNAVSNDEIVENQVIEEEVANKNDGNGDSEAESNENNEPLDFDEWLHGSDFADNPDVLLDLNELSVEEIVQYYQSAYSLEDDWYSVAYTNLLNDDTYTYREDEKIIAASTTKVLVAMVYYDLVENEEIALDTFIPYYPVHFQDGGGEITAEAIAGNAEDYYPLEYVIQELITASDNTAWVMLRYYYNENIGNFNEAMNEVLLQTDYPVEMLEENETTATYSEEILLELLRKDYYEPILEFMRQADEDMFLLYYVANNHPVKYGLLHNLNHHIGIYEIDEEPVYTLVILTNDLDYDNANLFMGGINLQLAVQREHDYYSATFDE